MIRDECDFVTTRTKTKRVIVSQASRQLSRLGIFDSRDPDMGSQVIGKRGARFVLDAIDHYWVGLPVSIVLVESRLLGGRNVSDAFRIGRPREGFARVGYEEVGLRNLGHEPRAAAVNGSYPDAV